MKASDLRIGNLLLNDGVVVTIDARTIFDIWNDEGAKKYKPIPLTEEWLGRLGLTERPESTQKQAKKTVTTWIKNEFFIFHDSEDNSCRVNLLNSEELGIKTTSCSYAHQLQNLYYSLTGQELTLIK